MIPILILCPSCYVLEVLNGFGGSNHHGMLTAMTFIPFRPNARGRAPAAAPASRHDDTKKQLIYPLVNSHITIWKITIFYGKIHYFYGHVQ
jgi:hypothetical protein